MKLWVVVPTYVTLYRIFHRCADRRLTWSKIVCTLWPTNGCKSQRIWGIGVGDTDVNHFMGGIASFSGDEWLCGIIQPTVHKILLLLGRLLPCMDLVISRFIQMEVQLSIFTRQRYFSYRYDILLLFGKMGNCKGVVKSWEELVAPSTLPPSLVLLWTQYTMNVIPDLFQGWQSWVILCKLYLCRVCYCWCWYRGWECCFFCCRGW